MIIIDIIQPAIFAGIFLAIAVVLYAVVMWLIRKAFEDA